MTGPMIRPVLLAGGSGSRLWPVSRAGLPKQFRPLFGERSTYQAALQRVADPSVFAPALVVTHEDFRFFARRQAAEVGAEPAILLEPARRDSAAAIAVAALEAERRAPGGLVFALAADHVVLDADLFTRSVEAGLAAAREGQIVVFGLPPSAPTTSYGYIRPGPALGPEPDLHLVDSFVEKPDGRAALAYIEAGYLWNSGNFMFRSDVMIAAFERHAPAVLAAARAALDVGGEDLGFLRLDPAAFAKAPRISIDYAVIERVATAEPGAIAVVTGRFRWSDIGSWDAVWELSDRDADGNALQGRAVAEASANCLVHAEGLLATVVGVHDLVVVATPDAVLVTPRGGSQAVKGLVDRLLREGHAEAALHRRDYRPWGFVESLDSGPRFSVKRLLVDPGAMLSLQRHVHRAEHWTVVRGAARVTIGEDTRDLQENQSAYVPPATRHRLANPGRIPLEIIEVRTGGYLGEDDIERLDDLYNRR